MDRSLVQTWLTVRERSLCIIWIVWVKISARPSVYRLDKMNYYRLRFPARCDSRNLHSHFFFFATKKLPTININSTLMIYFFCSSLFHFSRTPSTYPNDRFDQIERYEQSRECKSSEQLANRNFEYSNQSELKLIKIDWIFRVRVHTFN